MKLLESVLSGHDPGWLYPQLGQWCRFVDVSLLGTLHRFLSLAFPIAGSHFVSFDMF